MSALPLVPRAAREFRVTAGLIHRLLTAYTAGSLVMETAAVDQITTHLTGSALRAERATALFTTATAHSAASLMATSPEYQPSHRVDLFSHIIATEALRTLLDSDGSTLTAELLAPHLCIVDFTDLAAARTLVVEAVWLTALIAGVKL